MLEDEITRHFRLQKQQKSALKRLKIKTVRDLLYHFPVRYENSGNQKTISGVTEKTNVILYGTIRKPEARRSWKTKRPISEAWLEDGTGKIKLVWFNQPYIAKMFSDGTMVKVSGRAENTSSIINPEIERISEFPIGGSDTVFGTVSAENEIYAIYHESKGVTSRWFRHAIQKILKQNVISEIKDPIPKDILNKYSLPKIETALVWIHKPKKEKDAKSARKRFSFEEIFTIQVAKQQLRQNQDLKPAYSIKNAEKLAEEFIKTLPFKPTKGQSDAISSILKDISSPPAMSRLLEGDVGSGKTVVAAATSYAVVKTAPEKQPSATLQVAYMAPTEILAEQLFNSFIRFFKYLPIQIGLITSSGAKKYPSKVNPEEATKISKNQLMDWVKNGEISILIGTHSLIQKKVQFKNLAYVIIDEQHRFGTNQRQILTRKNEQLPHLLSMTATPIPRTLALTIYGDLDITVLDEMPPGRKKIITKTISKIERKEMYTNIRKELDAGRQAYIVCPRIDEADPQNNMAVHTKSVKEETKYLKRTEFKDYNVEMLHGQMKPSEKDEIMKDFMTHKIDVLVATSVVEVGVNMPNATVIVIEGAERFGLAQLHQLRGRVVRSNHQAYCYVLTTSGTVSTRLKALTKAKNGFELAEMDLKIRGPGELYGKSQSGITDLGMEAMKNIKMVEAARKESQKIIKKDPTLEKHSTLKDAINIRKEKLHFE